MTGYVSPFATLPGGTRHIPLSFRFSFSSSQRALGARTLRLHSGGWLAGMLRTFFRRVSRRATSNCPLTWHCKAKAKAQRSPGLALNHHPRSCSRPWLTQQQCGPCSAGLRGALSAQGRHTLQSWHRPHTSGRAVCRRTTQWPAVFEETAIQAAPLYALPSQGGLGSIHSEAPSLLALRSVIGVLEFKLYSKLMRRTAT